MLQKFTKKPLPTFSVQWKTSSIVCGKIQKHPVFLEYFHTTLTAHTQQEPVFIPRVLQLCLSFFVCFFFVSLCLFYVSHRIPQHKFPACFTFGLPKHSVCVYEQCSVQSSMMHWNSFQFFSSSLFFCFPPHPRDGTWWEGGSKIMQAYS